MKTITVLVLLSLCVGFINARAVPSGPQTPKVESNTSGPQEQQDETQTDSSQTKEQQFSTTEADKTQPQEQSSTTETDSPQTQEQQPTKTESDNPQPQDQGSSRTETDNPQSQETESSTTKADNPDSQEQGSSITETENTETQESTTEADNAETQDENVAGAAEDDSADASGSAMEDVEVEGSGGSGSADIEYNDSPIQVPKPYQLPLTGFKGPVTITPMEPNINRQRPFKYNRPCFFCFPRGRLGRVEVTAPGGPFLMNNYGLVGYGMGPGYGMGMGPASPNMGFPEYGPYPVGPLGEQLPTHGNHGGYQDNDHYGGSDVDSDGPEEGPMEFTDISEEPAPSHPKAAGKPMGHPGPRVMDQGKNAHPAAPVAPVAPVKAPAIKPALSVSSPVKPVSDELAQKPATQAQPSAQTQAQPSAQIQAQPQAAPPAAAAVQTPAQSEQPAAPPPATASNTSNTASNNVQPQQASSQPSVREEVPQAI